MSIVVQTVLRPTKMMFTIVLLVSFSYAAAQSGCTYTHDKTSPFYWKQMDNLCTDDMCTKQNLNCLYPAEDIHDAVLVHRNVTGVNIMYEIGILERTFNATFPDEYFGSTSKYHCKGICERPFTRLERIFYDYPRKDRHGKITKSRQLCFVVGPQIRYSTCSGAPCTNAGGDTEAYNCVPDVTTSLTVWLFCPNILPQCVKTQLEIPISCSCKRFQCPKKVEPFAPPSGPALDLFGGMGLFSGGLAPPGSGPDPFGAPQPVDVLGGSNVDLGGQFQSVDMASFGQVGSNPAMGSFSDQHGAHGGAHAGGANMGGVHTIV